MAAKAFLQSLDLKGLKEIRKTDRTKRTLQSQALLGKLDNNPTEAALAADIHALEEVLRSLADLDTRIMERLLAEKSADQVEEKVLMQEFKEVSQITTETEAVLFSARRRLNVLTASSGNTSPAATPPKGFKIQNKIPLPMFSGDPLHWQEWWGLYKHAVHENADMTTVEKFFQLSQLLKDKAEFVMDGVRISDNQERYEEVINDLHVNFGDECQLIALFSQRLLSCEKASLGPESLRKLLHKFEASLRELRHVLSSTKKQAETERCQTCLQCQHCKDIQLDHSDMVLSLFLAPLLLTRLPDEIETQWKRQCSKPREVFDLQALLTFARRELRTIASSADYVDTSEFSGSKCSSNPASAPVRAVSFVSQSSADLSKKKPRGEKFGKKGEKDNRKKNPCQHCRGSGHAIYRCMQFLALAPEARYDFVKQNRGICYICLGSHEVKGCESKINCYVCQERHHSLLHHSEKAKPASESTMLVSTEPVMSQGDRSYAVGSSGTSQLEQVMLQTAVVKLSSPDGGTSLKARILLDQGSTRTYIRGSDAKKLGMKARETRVFRNLVFGEMETQPRELDLVDVVIQGTRSGEVRVQAWTAPKLAHPLPPQKVDFFSHLRGYDLADDGTPICDLSMIVGADFYWDIVIPEEPCIRGRPMLIPSVFGYLMHGPVAGAGEVAFTNRAYFTHEDIGALWQLESLGISSEESDLPGNVTLKHDRYEAKLPWKGDGRPAPNFRASAFRASKMESFLTEVQFKEYQDYVEKLEESDVIEKSHTPKFYLPHFGLHREGKNLRVVFDGSAGINRFLEVGPNLLQELFGVLLQARIWTYLVQGDVRGAFHQIVVREEDRDFLSLLWQGQTYRFRRLPFGLCCSPEILNEAIRDLLQRHETEFPDTVGKLRRGNYVDDVVSGGHATEELVTFRLEAEEIFRRGGFELRKWKSFPVEICSSEDQKNLQDSLLGLTWDRTDDSMAVDTRRTLGHVVGTKRQLISVVSKVFDPIGVAAPWTLRGRHFIQRAWSAGLGWDQPLDEGLQREIQGWQAEAADIGAVKFPRKVLIGPNATIHVFSDASLVGYAACVYVVTGETVGLLTAKARVSPLKPTTIPRLELLGCLLGTKLVQKVKEVMPELVEAPVHFWTDSQICLYWVKGCKAKLKIFVKNRVKQIQEVPGTWHHVPGQQNPADFASRGGTLAELANNSLWWSGPPYLLQATSFWPPDVEGKMISEEVEPVAVNEILTEDDSLGFINEGDFNDFGKLISVTMHWQRFVWNLMRKVRTRGLPADLRGYRAGLFSNQEKEDAVQYWIRRAQMQAFPEFHRMVRPGAVCPKSSNLAPLRPRMVSGVMVGQPRNGEPPLPILPAQGQLVELIFRQKHRNVFHAGPAATLTAVRMEFHVLRGRAMAKSIVKDCRVCRRYRALPSGAKEGDLPPDRVTPCPPFSVCGADFFGPIYCEGQKFWVLLVTCAVTRGIHLELATDQSLEETALAFRRFVALRGAPRKLYSDNAKTFVSLARSLSGTKVTWDFIPEYCPHFGGFYERLVGVVKSSLRISLHGRRLRPIELRTVLHEVASAVNSRPLTYVSSSEDPQPLTPNHFLLGCGPEGTLNDPVVVEEGVELGKKWRARLSATDAVWRRFTSEYLPTLRQWASRDREVFPPVHPGDVVIVRVPDPAPRSRWPLARVESIIIGRGTPHAAWIILNGKRTRRHLDSLFPLECPREHLENMPPVPQTPVIEELQPPVDDEMIVEPGEPLPDRTTRSGRRVHPRQDEDFVFY